MNRMTRLRRACWRWSGCCSSSSSSSPRWRARGMAWSAGEDGPKRPSSAPKAMIDMKHIRQNPEAYARTCVERKYDSQAGHPQRIVELHEGWQALQRQGRGLREKSNLLRKQLANSATSSGDEDEAVAALRTMSWDAIQAQARAVKAELTTIERAEAQAVAEMEALALALPNLTSAETPRGDEPEVIGYIGERPRFEDGGANLWRSHAHIGAELGIVDLAAAATSSGWGWYYLVGDGARLEHALTQFALSVATKHGWTPVSPPTVVYSHIGAACGFRPRDQHGEQQVYTVAQSAGDAARGSPELCLAGTAEIPLAGMKAGSTMDADALPLRTVAASRCFRAEAGARGAETKGLYRVHEFTKVELFAWCAPDEHVARKMLDDMVALQSDILRQLGLHCRVLSMPAGDLGAAATRKTDIEAWFPSRGQHAGGWGEVTSASCCTDYQTRRLGTRSRSKRGELAFPWTLNATALAVPRVLAALLENGWDEGGGTVRIPPCLGPWMDGRESIGPALRHP